MQICALLNYSPPPTPASSVQSLSPAYDTSLSPASSNSLRSAPATPAPRFSPTMPTTQAARVKMAKKLIMDRGPAKCPIDYPPYEVPEQHGLLPARRQHLREMQRRFMIKPAGGPEGLIGDYNKSVPYTSSKSHLGSRTGRLVLELMQYTFVVPETNSEHTVLWDYQTGYVQMTPFFKALNHIKTAPAKALNSNPGLAILAVHVNGGCINAQGYWIPHACAKELCASFCFPIRWALTPLFGPDFVDQCIPDHSPDFKTKQFHVSAETIRVCALQADDNPGTATRSESPLTNMNPFGAPRSKVISSSIPGRILPARRSVRRQRPFHPAAESQNGGLETEDSDYHVGRDDDDGGDDDDPDDSPPSSPRTIGFAKRPAISDRRPSNLRLTTTCMVVNDKQAPCPKSQQLLTPYTVNNSPEPLSSCGSKSPSTPIPQSSERVALATPHGTLTGKRLAVLPRSPLELSHHRIIHRYSSSSPDEVVHGSKTSTSSSPNRPAGDARRTAIDNDIKTYTAAPSSKRRRLTPLGTISKGPAARRGRPARTGPTSAPNSHVESRSRGRDGVVGTGAGGDGCEMRDRNSSGGSAGESIPRRHSLETTDVAAVVALLQMSRS